MLCGLVVLATVASTGCCGRLRACVFKWKHCHGCCVPSFDAPAYGGPAPGCATCYAAPADAGVPIVPTGGAPVFGTPLHAPTPLGPPTVTQTSEPPMSPPKAGGK
jgi:hypothetical protein